METYIKGQYRKSIYENESGYCIGLFKVKETNDEDIEIYIDRVLTFTGYFFELNTEDTYIFYGHLVEHERYGEQFQVTRYERVLPEEKDSIVEFLSSGLFKGIGEKKAKKIVEALGKDTLSIILEYPENLLLVPTITKKQADMLHDTLLEYEASYKTILALNELGFSTKDSMLIYRKYQEKTTTIIEENIYLLLEKIEDLGFKKVDRICLLQGYKKDDPRRVKASIIYVMEELSNRIGHTYFLNGEIYGYLISVLQVEIPIDDYDRAMNELVQDMKVVVSEDKYYLMKMYEAEKKVSDRLLYLTKQQANHYPEIDTDIHELEKNYGISYNHDQKEAIKKALEENILIITGGPGTGKTTIIKAITELYKKKYKLSYADLMDRVALLAPTGRASKRISESTVIKAVTIHRFLKWNKDTNLFAINEYNKSDVEMVIIDEVSMVDIVLFDHLLKGLHTSCKIILVGDDNQLPSVGPGQILKDMIESDALPVVKLNELYRQKEGSNIISLAYQINNDNLDFSIFNQEEDLTFLDCNEFGLRENIKVLVETYKDLDNKKFQVLAPMYKTINGIDNLNLDLQAILNPKDKRKKELLINGVVFRENDKVIQLTNMPDENVFNGDIGTIVEIENGSKKKIIISYDGQEVEYSPSSFNKFKHAYAISIHKSQGSEFDFVVLPLVQSYHKMLYRKLIYTAVTRAKKKLILLGDKKSLMLAVSNNQVDLRRTTLKEMLKKSIK